MAKGQDAKKTVKKPATKTLKEKRNDKKAKSQGGYILICNSFMSLKIVNAQGHKHLFQCSLCVPQPQPPSIPITK